MVLKWPRDYVILGAPDNSREFPIIPEAFPRGPEDIPEAPDNSRGIPEAPEHSLEHQSNHSHIRYGHRNR